MYNKATKYLSAGKHEKALSFYKKQIKEHAFKEAYLNMGNACRYLDRDMQAIEYYKKAASVDVPFANGKTGPYALALNNLGLCAYMLGDDDLSIEYYRAALELDPAYGEAIWNYSISELRRTNSTSAFGWRMYQYRFNRGEGSVNVDVSLPFWDGTTSGSSICVLTEQGLGDKIMFGRYLRYLKDYFSTVYIVCHESLDCLYTDGTASSPICIRSVTECPATISIPICSLSAIFGLKDENWLSDRFIPSSLPGDFKIGCVWEGSTTHANNRNRSCTSNYMSSLSSYGSLYALSPGSSARNMVSLNPSSWSSTASHVLAMDVIVTVDTSIVHLAGTLGVPCIMVQPLKDTDFRWGNTNKNPPDINPWYKSVVVVPNNNNWDAAFKTVREMLEKISR